ncbi:MAG: hypothetical protein EWV76_11935 [Microcystis novacekii Mn_MB_F_20050700_S1]|nr:MAG: hypothetical protein EWV76_11935 [Microcystis novacekii Mn_MB_F_20050700_S1]
MRLRTFGETSAVRSAEPPNRRTVLGTRTDAGVGKVRLTIFRGRKRIPLKQEALNAVESSSRAMGKCRNG